MDYTALIAAIIQAGPDISKAIADLVKSNPQQQGETDAAYIARIHAQSATLAADTTATDQQVENG